MTTMVRPHETSLIDVVADAAGAFAAVLAADPRLKPMPAPDFAAAARQAGTLQRDICWTNDLRSGPLVRQAHVELFVITGQIAVLHVCLCPALDRDWPIFGFDLITGRQKATGVFMDLSPTGVASRAVAQAWATTPGCSQGFGEPRALPDWALAVFSPHAVAARPDSPAHVRAALDHGRAVLDGWLAGLDGARPGDGRAAQAAYARAQRQNEHTDRMLSRAVGADIARDFIQAWLFPDPGMGTDDEQETLDAI